MMSRPEVNPATKIVMQVDGRGVTLYCNRYGIGALIDELQWIKSSDPAEHFESHIRMHFADVANETLRVIISKELNDFFTQLPDGAEHDAIPAGFELTIMQVPDHEIATISETEI